MGEYYDYEIEDLKIVDISSVNASLSQYGAETPQSKRFQASIRAHQEGKCKRFQKFLYNKETKTTCNRSGKHWGKLLFYYSFFLSLLTITFLCFLYGIFRGVGNTNRSMPTLKKISTFPAPTFGFVPLKSNSLSEPIIWYEFSGRDKKENRRSAPYVQEIKEFYRVQQLRCASLKMSQCTVQQTSYGPCGEPPFGYEEQKPCIILKLNTMDNWGPDAFHSAIRIPQSMPEELKKKIDLKIETVCIFCEGKSLFDKEHMGNIKYYPSQCYNESFFPYGEGPLNVNAAIAMQLENPTPGILLTLRCRLFGVDIDGTGIYDQFIYIYVGAKRIEL